MPFDGTLIEVARTRRDRLMILRELVQRQSDVDQRDFNSCLWHAARHDPRLIQAGLREKPVYAHLFERIESWFKPAPPPRLRPHNPEINDLRFFGMAPNRDVFGADPVQEKVAMLNQLIREC